MQIFLAFFVLLCANSFAQNKLYCLPGEEVVFSFQLKNSKWAYVCKDTSNQYLVYRFGKANKVELQYPAVLDTSSWGKFSLQAYERGGGIKNAAMNFAYLHFTNNDVQYEVYNTWAAEGNTATCGVLVTVGNKHTDLKGILKTRKGYLLNLTETRIPKEE